MTLSIFSYVHSYNEVPAEKLTGDALLTKLRSELKCLQDEHCGREQMRREVDHCIKICDDALQAMNAEKQQLVELVRSHQKELDELHEQLQRG